MYLGLLDDRLHFFLELEVPEFSLRIRLSPVHTVEPDGVSGDFELYYGDEFGHVFVQPC